MYVPTHLAYLIESRQAAHQVAITHILHDRFALNTAHTMHIMGGYAIFQDGLYPTNRGQGMGFEPLGSEEELEQFEQFYRAQGVPAAIEVCPLVDQTFIQALGKRSYVVQRFYNTYALALPIPEPDGQRTSDIVIRQAHAEECELWAQTVAGTTQQTDPVMMLAKATFFAPGVRCLLASIQGEIAGGGAVVIMDDMAYLTFMGTRPAFRQRGVQQALLGARLAEASRAGCTLAICNTTPGSQSQRNVQRHGFSLAYTKVFLRKEDGGISGPAGAGG